MNKRISLSYIKRQDATRYTLKFELRIITNKMSGQIKSGHTTEDGESMLNKVAGPGNIPFEVVKTVAQLKPDCILLVYNR